MGPNHFDFSELPLPNVYSVTQCDLSGWNTVTCCRQTLWIMLVSSTTGFGNQRRILCSWILQQCLKKKQFHAFFTRSHILRMSLYCSSLFFAASQLAFFSNVGRETQNCLGWQGFLRSCSSAFCLRQGHLQPDHSSKLCPAWPSVLPGMRHPQLLWATCSSASLPSL